MNAPAPRPETGYNFAYLDEATKRMIRRAILKAIAIPGYQVPFAAREMPMPYGWGTGGVQVTAAILGRADVLKVIDQGADDTTNAVSIRRFFSATAGIATTTRTADATVIQTRHRIPEAPLVEGQILVYQVPIPEPLRFLEPRETETRQLHALAEYGLMHVKLYEDIARHGHIATTYAYPVEVAGRYVMDPSPTPKFDNPKMDDCPALQLFGAGREKRIYAVPPYTRVRSLDFEDHPFRVQSFDRPCALCAAEGVYLDEVVLDDAGGRMFVCSDTDHCEGRRLQHEESDARFPPPSAGEGGPRVSEGRERGAPYPERSLPSPDPFRGPPSPAEGGGRAVMTTPLLTATNLTKRYGPRAACDGVGFTLDAGEVLAVVGESGSGKSTLLGLIAGEVAADAGSVAYRMRDGATRDLATLSAAERRALMRTDWGFVRQDAAQGLRMAVSAGGNVGERLMGVGERHYGRIRATALDWLGRVEIAADRIDDPPTRFSGGMRQRLQIARNLVTSPRLVLMDEPTSGLDVSVQARLLDMVRGLVAELGLAVIIVTHDLAVARLLSHRVLVMRHGRVIETGLTDQVLDDPQAAYTQLLVSSVLAA